MRKIVMFNQVSADGYFATTDGTLDWVTSDDEVGKSAMATSGELDTVLLGRKTYEMFASFWPQAYAEAKASGKAPSPHGQGRSETTAQMAVFLHEARKLVVSKTLTAPIWHNTEVIKSLDKPAIEQLKHGEGKGIITFGSGQVVSTLTKHGLIDDYMFVVSPILLGNGRKLIEGIPQRPLSLFEVKPFASGVTLLRYVVKAA
jgi:dihydrofolate reductase